MRNCRFLYAALLALVLSSGCIATRPRGWTPDESAKVIPDVPVRRWGDNTCGSAALAAVLNHLGDGVTEAELNGQFAKGRNGGVVSIDLLLEARRRGFDAALEPGDRESVIGHLQEGRPVIIMVKVVNLPGERRDLFHYVVLDGVDVESDLVRMQFGDGRARWAPLASLAQPWEGAGRATLVVRRRTDRTATPDTNALLRRAVALEDAGKTVEALAIYRQIVETTDHPSLIWTNIGNAESKLGDSDAAETAYLKAIAIDPTARDAMNNLAWMLLASGSRLDEAEQFARRAAAIEGPDGWTVLETLGRLLAARGACSESSKVFRRAVDAAPDTPTRAGLEAGAAEATKSCVEAVASR